MRLKINQNAFFSTPQLREENRRALLGQLRRLQGGVPRPVQQGMRQTKAMRGRYVGSDVQDGRRLLQLLANGDRLQGHH